MRVMVLVDGMNLYHSTSDLVDLGCDETIRWLDISALIRSNLSMFGPTAQLVRIFYFSSLLQPSHASREKRQWQTDYIQALKDNGPVGLVEGRFIDKKVECYYEDCARKYTVPVEKKTDVNIAIKILELCYLDQCDVIVLISGDSDLLDALSLAKGLFGGQPHNKRFCVIFPYRRYNAELANRADFRKELKQSDYLNHPLPPRVLPPPPPPKKKKYNNYKWRN